MKKRALFFLGLLCLCLLFSVESQAQTSTPPPAASPKGIGKIYGTLTDSLTGKPVEYVTVALLQNGKSVDGTLTDSQGRYSFQQVEKGSYMLQFSFIGYETKKLMAVSVTDQTPEVKVNNVRLSQTATKLKEVTVEGLRPLITQEADKLVVSVEGTAMAAGRTAFDVLAKSPGVFIDPDGNIQLNGRAGVTVMLNGKLTYLSSNDLRNMLESMSAENIKNIEIITNPSAKYDADGTSGILNINLKKNELQGINGSLQAGVNTNLKQVAYNIGGSIYQRSGPWNSFLTADLPKRIGNREGTFTRIFYGKEQTTYIDQVTEGKHKNLGPPNFRLGTDYSFNDNHSIGGVASLNRNTAWIEFLSDTYLGTNPTQPREFVEADNFTKNTFTSFTSNVHYSGKLDTVGTTLSADLDFVKIANLGNSNFFNYYGLVGNPQPPTQDFLFTDTDNGFNIYAAKVDFAKTLSPKSKMELGAKASRVESDNDSKFYFNNAENLVLDPNRTNHFVYDENIYAAYINWNSKVSDRFSIQTGLRAEATQSKGNSITTKQITNREYLNFFPSIFLQQKVTENYQVSYSYSRRIQRPNYGNLNPFIIYRDPYTYTTGNPYLKPQYTNSFGVTQTFKKYYNLNFNYHYMQNVMVEMPILDLENALTIYTTGNVDDSHSYSLAAIAPVKIMKNWDTNNTLTLAYNEFRVTQNNKQEVNARVLYMLQSTHNVLLPYGVRMEVNGVVRGPSVSGLYQVSSMWWMHLAFRKSFMDKKFDLSVNMNDVFRSYRLRFDTRISGNVNDFDQYLYQQNVGLSLRYNFSRGQKFDPKKRNNTLEELNRT